MKHLIRFARPIYFIPLLILFFVFSQYLFPKYGKQITDIAGKKLATLDVRWSYSIDDVDLLFTEMGAEGRAIYQFVESRIDMIFPLIYGPLFFLLWAFFLKEILSKDSKLHYLSVLAGSTMVFDYVENFSILHLLRSYKQLSEGMVLFSATFTFIKKSLFIFSLLGIIILFLIWLRLLWLKRVK